MLVELSKNRNATQMQGIAKQPATTAAHLCLGVLRGSSVILHSRTGAQKRAE